VVAWAASLGDPERGGGVRRGWPVAGEAELVGGRVAVLAGWAGRQRGPLVGGAY
jgi:hypothetical protein